MSGLKSYSCSKCGGILNVDRDQDVLECPFCGTQIDYLEYHSEDLLTQADNYLSHKSYDTAKEKYNTIISSDPSNFVALRGIAFCAGEISSPDKLNNPANLNKCFYNGILRVLSEDRYRNSPYAGYFAKLAELITKAQEFNKLNREKNSLYLSSINGSRKYTIDNMLDQKQHGLKIAEEEYATLYAELKALEPEVKTVSHENKKMAFGSVTPSYGLLRIGCAKCGGTLSLDKERKLYTCNNCGIAYGYSLFYGDPMQKAMAELKDGDFDSADQRFVHILMFDQRNADANRGRVLCAGKWKSFTEIKLDDKLTKVDWQLIQQRVDECYDHVRYPYELYYELIGKTMNLLKDYSDTLIMMQIEPNNQKYLEKKEKLSKVFPSLIRRLMYIDRTIHSVSHGDKTAFDFDRLTNAPEALRRGDFVEAEDCYRILNLDHPNDPLILHNWVLCAGKWPSFSKMKITDFRSRNLFSLLLNRVVEAQQLSDEKYHSFYDTLFELLGMINQYHENELIIKQCRAAEDSLSDDVRKGEIDVNDDKITDKWMELTARTKNYENIRMDYKKAFAELLNKFLQMDRELFGE